MSRSRRRPRAGDGAGSTRRRRSRRRSAWRPGCRWRLACDARGEAAGRPSAVRAAGLPAPGAPRRPATRGSRRRGRRRHHRSDDRCVRTGAAIRGLRARRGADLRPRALLGRWRPAGQGEILRCWCRRRTSRSCGGSSRRGRSTEIRSSSSTFGIRAATTTRSRSSPRRGLPWRRGDSHFFSDFQQAYHHLEITVKAITPVRDDRVLLHTTLSAEGRESGLKLQQELFCAFWLRHGRVFRQEDHFTLPGALHALGLSGQTLEAAGLSE